MIRSYNMNGFLYVDKPKGWTSFDVVNYVRRKVANIVDKKPRNVKVGHTGTLDPAATGLLILCVGRYTKKVPGLIKEDKTYLVEVTLGRTSTTGDTEGDIQASSSQVPSLSDVEDSLSKFTGDILQTPPIYSAIKVNGERAYKLAREGKEVKLKPRQVTVYSIEEIEYQYPILKFKTRVSSGTYVRSLAQDIGEQLGVGAYMSNLRRTMIGKTSMEDSLHIDDITEDELKKQLDKSS